MCTTGKRPGTLALAGGILFGTCPVLAHDFWLEPSSYRLDPGSVAATRRVTKRAP